jgi:hypothetical protein
MQSETIFEMSRKRAIATGSGRAWQGPETALRRSFGIGSRAERPAKHHKSAKPAVISLGPRPFAAHAHQFHRPVRNRDPEGRADGALHQMNIAAMGADQFGGNRKAEPAAAGPAG